MSDETYNGWANRETWAFNLHWQNDQGLYAMVLEYAREILAEYGRQISDSGLGERVVTYVEDELPELFPELWENMRSDVGSFWRISLDETGACVRESLENES